MTLNAIFVFGAVAATLRLGKSEYSWLVCPCRDCAARRVREGR